MDFIRSLPAIRKKRGLSQARLAALAGISQQHVSLIERGKANIEFETLRKILNALGHTLVLREISAELRQALAARQAQWGEARQAERSLTAPLSPAERLCQVGELVDFFRARHGDGLPEAQTLAKEAQAIQAWRILLGKVRGRA